MRIILMAALAAGLLPALPARGDDAQIAGLIRQLSGFDFPSIEAAQEKLKAIGEPALPAIKEALKNEDPGIRRGALQVLAGMKGAAAVDEIGPLVKDDQYWVARAAVYALKDIGSPQADPYLLQALKHFKAEVKEAALYAVKDLKLAAATDLLADRMLRDLDQYVRWRAMTVLRELKPGAEIEVIKKAVADPALSATQERNAVEYVGFLGLQEIVPALVALLNDPDAGVRWRTLEALGKNGAVTALPEIRKKLSDRDEGVRLMAIGVLGMLRSPESVGDLAAQLKGKSTESRKNAVLSLKKIGGAEAAAAVRTALSDRDKLLRAQAAEVLGEIGGAADAEELSKLGADREAVVRAAAYRALGRLRVQEARAVLEAGRTDKNFWARQEAELALLRLPPAE